MSVYSNHIFFLDSMSLSKQIHCIWSVFIPFAVKKKKSTVYKIKVQRFNHLSAIDFTTLGFCLSYAVTSIY
ncbi:hypothetical protein XELAEV_18015464mg [Xenopus laevis]|uniref:Uncharacterized protein n=1 Tax=Xenopus laevis TaxID=8355 RepID=A0A974HW61_XENLA|nr:hypothetical protein XELAEV_18015464mg [Xenopus laevis]